MHSGTETASTVTMTMHSGTETASSIFSPVATMSTGSSVQGSASVTTVASVSRLTPSFQLSLGQSGSFTTIFHSSVADATNTVASASFSSGRPNENFLNTLPSASPTQTSGLQSETRHVLPLNSHTSSAGNPVPSNTNAPQTVDEVFHIYAVESNSESVFVLPNEANEDATKVFLPDNVVNGYDALHLHITTYSDDSVSIILLSLSDPAEEIRQLSNSVRICLKSNGELDRSCLAFFNEKTSQWECEDCTLEKEGDLGCGTTSKSRYSLFLFLIVYLEHLTNFALLLHSDDPTGKCQGPTHVIIWLSLSFIVAALFFCILAITAIELHYYKKRFNRQRTLKHIQKLTQMNAMPTLRVSVDSLPDVIL